MDSGKRILLIDDEEVMLFGFSKVLQEPGVEVDCARSLEEVRTCIAAHRYDAAIVDLRLSNLVDMEGFDCIRLLRSGQMKCRIIVLTAFADNGFKEEAEMLGIDLFFEKPQEPETIRDALKQFAVYRDAPASTTLIKHAPASENHEAQQ
ncbi:MAG: response regulator [Chitinispirillaceae bacterium]|nr:response regulator [Chitinispirillaceae bacterium]